MTDKTIDKRLKSNIQNKYFERKYVFMSKFDAVVIGSGTGGLSAALSLATAGKKVLLMEQHNLPGGCASSFVRGRFEFDASLHEFCSIGYPGNWALTGKLIMEKYKLNVDWVKVPELYRCIGTLKSGRHIDAVLPCGKDNFINKMEELVPGSRKPMEQFFELTLECNEAYNYFNEHLHDGLDKNGFTYVDEGLFMKKYPNFLKIAEYPFNVVLRKIGMPEDAIDILNVYWTYIGTDYERLSFVHQAWMMLMYIEYFPAFCKKTAHALTMAGIERLRELGGELWLNTKALEVVADENGKIKGVETTAGFVETNYVIANMNPQDAYTKLLSKNIKVPEREIKRANAEKHGVRFFNAYVALNKSVEELGIKDYTIFMPGDLNTEKNYAFSKDYNVNNHSVVVIYNVLDKEASPEGTTLMTFTITYTEDVWGDFSQREYVSKKQELFKKVMDNFEKDTGIIIHDCIEEIEMASPWTFCNFLGTPQGTVYGYECSEWDTMVARLLTLRKEQPIHGFKTCGASGARGDGYNQTYLNGDDMATLLLMDMAEDEKEGK